MITKSQLTMICQNILCALGATEEECKITAEQLVKANLRGVDTHGVGLLLQYARRIQSGLIKINANVHIVRETSSTALLDGDGGLGQVAGVKAMELAIRKAKGNGVGVATIRNSNHFGMLCHYPMMAIEEDMIGCAICNTAAVMAPWGGRARILGNNPIAFAIPAGKEKPIVYDAALSVVAGQRIYQAYIKGEKIPEGWAFDSMGRPTTDPSKVRSSEGYIGLLAPMGGHKGYCLSVIFDILCCALTGANFSMDNPALVDLSKTWNGGCFTMAIDIGSFISVEEFKDRVDEFIKTIKSSPVAEGSDEILLPGEREYIEEEKRLMEGIPIEEKVWINLSNLAKQLGINVDHS
jgi:LDH2 family malate/lactate/ureidoglycolate dehydrogenase